MSASKMSNGKKIGIVLLISAIIAGSAYFLLSTGNDEEVDENGDGSGTSDGTNPSTNLLPSWLTGGTGISKPNASVLFDPSTGRCQIVGSWGIGHDNFPLKEKSFGCRVANLQHQLNKYAKAGLTVDGKYGATTGQAVAARRAVLKLSPSTEMNQREYEAMIAADGGVRSSFLGDQASNLLHEPDRITE